MGAAALAPVALLALVAAAAPARADSCTATTKAGKRFGVCYDPGNRLSVTAGSDGFGGSIALRQVVHFEDDPDLEWKLEHQIGEVASAGGAIGVTGLLYRGRYLRHTRDGHIVIPGSASKVFLPFDIGGLVEAGRLTRLSDGTYQLGIVKTAALIDLWRSRDFRRRLAIGPVARWEVGVTRDPNIVLAHHTIAPFSAGIASLHAESANGLTSADLSIEAGTAWSTDGGWRPDARAEASLERIVVAVNDRPIALVLGARYATATDEAIASIGARVVLYQAKDPRVSTR